MALPTAGIGPFLGTRGGDLVVHIESMQKCFNSTVLTGHAATNTAAKAGSPTGYGLVAGVPVEQGEEASIDAFIVFGDPIPALAAAATSPANAPYTIIDNFDGAVLNEDAVQLVDVNGAALTLATIKGAAALADVKWVSEPAKIEEQAGGTPT